MGGLSTALLKVCTHLLVQKNLIPEALVRPPIMTLLISPDKIENEIEAKDG